MRTNRVSVYQPPWDFSINLLLRQIVDHSGQKLMVGKIEMVEYDDQTDLSPYAFPVSPEEAQRLMDGLWNVGLRPKAAAGSVGQLAATEKHLEDMRKLVFAPQVIINRTESI